MLLTETVKVRWHSSNKKRLEKLGYKFTNIGDELYIKVCELTKGSNVHVEVQCDNCGNILSNVEWYSYIRHVKEDGNYYCNQCSLELYGIDNRLKTKLDNGLSFRDWCIINLSKNKSCEILDLWDYDKNDVTPNEVHYGTNKKYWFRCPRHLHESELKQINNITHNNGKVICFACDSFAQWCIDNSFNILLDRWDYSKNKLSPWEVHWGTAKKYWFKCPYNRHDSEQKYINEFTTKNNIGSMECKACNSFAEYNIKNLGSDFLEKYWDFEKNSIDPWHIDKGSTRLVWIKCQEKDYHGSYEIHAYNFSKGCRCSYCINHKIHYRDSLGYLYPKIEKIWSDKNKLTIYEYSPKSQKKVWWKCEKEEHEDYYREISVSNSCGFRCPECQFSSGEEFINNLLIKNNIYKIAQKEFNGLIGLGGGNLSYDFYIPQMNLLIEYQGEQHEKPIDFNGKGKKYAQEQFKRQQEHDRRKCQYAKDHGIKLLEIWYWDFDNIESILIQEGIIPNPQPQAI